LSKNINREHLLEIFGEYGKILNVDLPMNKECMFLFRMGSISCTRIASCLIER